MCDSDFRETVASLSKNGMEAEYLETGTALLERLSELIPLGTTAASGSSETLTALGVRRMLRDRNVPYFDAGDPSLSPEERDRVIRKAFQADVYLTSAAAVTKTGELLLVDGTGNRAAALAYEPRHVIMIMGKQKLVEDMEGAIRRLRTVAAPQNALRRGKTGLPCAKIGACANCRHPLRMCCYFLKIGFVRSPGRIRVLLVGEEAGF